MISPKNKGFSYWY